jgi:dipeptidyl aminopeptidase/acylaminoacyl peptidase
VRSIHAERRGVYLARVDRPAAQAGERLFHAESGVAYLPRAGSREVDLVYLVDGHVEARRFDTVSLKAAPTAHTLDFLPAEFTLNGPVMVTASESVMAYTESAVPSGNQLVSITLDGKDLRSWPAAMAHNWPRVSPDGRLIARPRMDETRSQPDMMVEDLERGTIYPVLKTLEPDMSPVWSPDGRQLAFVTGHLPRRQGNLVLNIAAADGTGVVRTLPCPGDYCEPTDWSTDGSTLLLTVLESGNSNVWTLPAEGGGEAQPLLTAAYDEREARFSPDGRWIAYVSEEAGRPEVLVHSLAGPSRRYTVSGEGGTQPVWRRDGKELYFANLQGQLHRVAVRWTGEGDPQFGLPTNPGLPRVGFGHWGTQYDVTPDGGRLYFMRPEEGTAPTEIQVAINWGRLLD